MKNLNLKILAKNPITFLIISVMFTTISCRENTRERDRTPQQTEIESRNIEREVEPRAFTGDIRAVENSGDLSGEIAMRVEGDLMRFTVSAEGLAPEMMHMQYLLVSQTGDETQCPGSVEEVERIGERNATTASSGTTVRRIPLHMGPSSLNMESNTYPRTNVNGELQFSRVVSLDSLRNAVRTEYNMQDLDFSKFTFVIRGIPDGETTSPQIRGTRSAQNTSVGCAKLQETAVSN